jgi:hypothetical protein
VRNASVDPFQGVTNQEFHTKIPNDCKSNRHMPEAVVTQKVVYIRPVLLFRMGSAISRICNPPPNLD